MPRHDTFLGALSPNPPPFSHPMRQLTLGERDRLDSLEANLIAGGASAISAARTRHAQEALILSGSPSEAPGLLSNALSDMSDFAHGLGSLIGSAISEGVVEPVGALLRGDLNAAAEEGVDAAQKALGFAKAVPGALVTGLEQGVLGALFEGDLTLAGARAHERPVTAALDIGFLGQGAGTGLKALGATRAGAVVSKVGRAVDPFHLAWGGVKYGFEKAVKGGRGIPKFVHELAVHLDNNIKVKRMIRNLLPEQQAAFMESVKELWSGDGNILDIVNRLYKLDAVDRGRVLELIADGRPVPPGASKAFTEAADGYRALFAVREGKISQWLDNNGVLTFSEQEAHIYQTLAQRRPDVLPAATFSLDRFKEASKAGTLKALVDQAVDVWRAEGGPGPAYISFQREATTVRKMEAWLKYVLPESGTRKLPGFLRSSDFTTLMSETYMKDLGEVLRLVSDQMVTVAQMNSKIKGLVRLPTIRDAAGKIVQRGAQRVPLEEALRNAIARLEKEGVRDVASNQFLEVLGKEIEELGFSMGDDVRLVSPDLGIAVERGAGDTIKHLKQQLAQGRDLLSAMDRRFKSAGIEGVRSLDELAALNATDTLPAVYSVPAEAVQALESQLPGFGTLERLARIVIDRPLMYLKRSWLGLSPSWMMSTIVGNAFLTLMGGALPIPGAGLRNYIDAFKPSIIKQIPVEATMGQFRNASAQTLLDTADLARQMGVGQLSKWAQLKQGLIGPMFGIVQSVDEYFRRVLYLKEAGLMMGKRQFRDIIGGFGNTMVRNDSLLEKLKVLRGELPEGTSDAVRNQVTLARREVVAGVVDWLGDYQTMTRAERYGMRRLVPFWPWWRHMVTLAVKMPAKFPVRTKALQAMLNMVREAENDELRREFGLDREQLADFFESSASAKSIVTEAQRLVDSPHGLEVLGSLAGALFGGGISASVKGALVGAGVGALAGRELDPSAVTSEPERDLAPLLMTTALNPFETAFDAAQGVLGLLGSDAVDPELQPNVAVGALAPQWTVPWEMISRTQIFSGQRFKTLTPEGREVDVGQEVLMPDGRKIRYGGAADIAMSRFGDQWPQFKTLLDLATPWRTSGKRIRTIDDWGALLADFANGRDTEATRQALRDPITDEPMPQSRWLKVLRMFGLNIKEVDVAKRKVFKRRWTQREARAQLTAWLNLNRRATAELATRGWGPAVEWMRRKLQRGARNERELKQVELFMRRMEAAVP